LKVGLFFGSFNPIHVGHLIIANIMVEHTDLDEVWFVVSPQNPFKKNNNLLHEFDRLEMVRQAVHDDYKFKASDVEFNMPRPSYTIDTLTWLSEKNKDKEFVLIIGEDNLAQFPRWKNYETILEYYSLYVYPRQDSEPSELKNHPKVKWVSAPMIDISATFIRKCVTEGKSIRYMVPDSVENYIKDHKFYI